MAGYYDRKTLPFKNVYFTGMVRDQQRRKMSKSLGNSPDPLDLIKQYGADGVRVGMLFCSPAGGDLLFDESLTEQGRNFSNKLWNSFRLIKGWDVDHNIDQPESSAKAIEWFEAKLNESLVTLDDHFSKFRISDALMEVYTLIRDEFSGWLLEAVKPAYQQPIDEKTYNKTLELLEKVLKVLHPFMPFITEEIYQLIEERADGDSIMISQQPKAASMENGILDSFEEAKEVISAIRNIRKEKNIAFKETLNMQFVPGEGYKDEFMSVVCKLGNIKEIEQVEKPDNTAAAFIIKTTEFAIPLGDMIDVDAEIAKLEEELKYNQGFLNSVMKKLSNERFVSGAPEKVVAMEKQKQADTESKIKTIEESLAKLKA